MPEGNWGYRILYSNHIDSDSAVSVHISWCSFHAIWLTQYLQHMAAKRSHIMKFVSFLGENCDFPFWVMWKVMDSALLSAILYGCEGWILNSAVVAQKNYLEIVKALLGVRTSTPNDTCLIELGLPSVTARVKAAQQRFIHKLIQERQGLTDDPFMAVWNLCSKANTKGARYLRDIMSHADHTKLDLESRRQKILNSTRTKSLTYVNLNPELSVYVGLQGCRPTGMQTPWSPNTRGTTRLRLSSHNLAIEKGRWSRIPRELRLCSCGSIQCEEHVTCICFCERTMHIRARYPSTDFTSIRNFFYSENAPKICKVTYDFLYEFQWQWSTPPQRVIISTTKRRSNYVHCYHNGHHYLASIAMLLYLMSL